MPEEKGLLMGDGDDRNRTNHWIMYGLPAATVVAILVFLGGTVFLGADDETSVSSDGLWQLASLSLMPIVVFTFWLLGRHRL
jgi:hypothetical protein